MNKLFFLMLGMGILQIPLFAVTADQKISAVTVYPDCALITRSGLVKLDGGTQTIVFENLPINLQEESVRARAQGKLKILGVEIRRDYKEVATNIQTKQAQDALTKLEDQIQVLNDELGDLQRHSTLMDQIQSKITTPSRGAESKDQLDSVQNLQQLVQFYSGERTKISTRQREINVILRDLNKQRDAQATQLSLLQQPAASNTRSALVTVEAAEPGEAELQVSYLMSGALWQPQYDAYADPETQKVEFTCYGVVRQTTGEDWNDVALTLSSARPSLAARLPDLMPWTVDFASPDQTYYKLQSDRESQVVAAKAMKELRSLQQSPLANNSANLPGQAQASVAQADDAPVQTAEIRTLGPAATFSVPAKVSIPTDNQPHRSAISVQTLKGDWTYITTPKLVQRAFLKTRVTNTSGAPFLGGDINVFLGNNYIGKSNIGLVAANASFDLFLGSDDNIKVTRTEGLKKEEVGGILSRLRVTKCSFKIEVENFKSTEAAFKLHDQVPVSKNAKIVVTINTADPAFKSRNEDTGELTWEFKLKPNEKRTVSVEYEVDAPYEQPVTGI